MASELESLHQCGLLGPDNIFNHCTSLPDEGWKILREAGVRVNVCPRSDVHYGIEDGMFAIQAAQRHGISPGLSVDNETSYSTVMIGGRIVKQNGKVLGVDSERLRAAIDESRQHLFTSAGYEPDIFADAFLPL